MFQVKSSTTKPISRPLRVGDVVEVKPLAEIMATLDQDGKLDGMPFMPEMAAQCGRRAQVSSRAHKTCDGHGNLRWLDDTVHLKGVHCDGSGHGGCQARCQTFWKAAWLNLVPDARVQSVTERPVIDDVTLLNELSATTRREVDGSPRFVCQSTEVNSASVPLPVTNAKQYIWDVQSGNCSITDIVWVMARTAYNRYQRWAVRRLPRALQIRGGRTVLQVNGRGVRTPKRVLDLRIGERARIKPLHEIEKTLNSENMNRGLKFDSEMAGWCGVTSTVVDRVERIVDDRTGEMIEIASDCVVLEGVTCRGHNRRLCSRRLYDYWREIWLEREDDGGSGRETEACT